MARAPEYFDVDEQGVLRHPRADGACEMIGSIQTSRRNFEKFGPFDQSERDLVRLAVAVLNADRQCLRRLPGRHSEEEQEANRLRSLRLSIPMENPERWKHAEEILVRLLRFMTDDQWMFDFTQAVHTPGEPLPLFPEHVPQETELALFSGGLDSVAGLWARHRAGARRFIAVTAYGDNAKLAKRASAIGALTSLGVRVELLGFHHHLRWTPVKRAEELSQRTRGFVFFSIAAAMASALRLSAVATYEAGIGALNVPANDAQIGAQNTRAMHPWSLLQLERLFKMVLDRPIRVEAPFLLQTKGEVCRLAGADLERLAQVAMSCDETEARKATLEHCGVCTSCLLRRAALRAAMGDADPTIYRDHATKTHGNYDVQAFAAQAVRFRKACHSFDQLMHLDPDIRHALRFHADRGLTRCDAERLMCEMFSRQASEAEAFIASDRFPRLPLVASLQEATR